MLLHLFSRRPSLLAAREISLSFGAPAWARRTLLRHLYPDDRQPVAWKP
jgi:hypothetical protein